jgi:DNA ligase 1
VTPSLVLEVAFDAIQLSKRHKSGVAMRFPRISRIRWDKPASEADTVQTLRKLISV